MTTEMNDMHSFMLSDRGEVKDKLTLSRCFASSKRNSNTNRRKKISSTKLQLVMMLSSLE